MRFKTAENRPEELADLLRARGFDCATAVAQGLAGQPDDRISETCRRENRILKISQPRASDLLRGRIDLFSSDMLID